MFKSYHFITQWRVEATREEVYHTLEEVEDLTRWWRSVYLDLEVLEKGQKGGVGKVVELHTKGFLPYTLRWKFKVTETNFPHGFSLEAFGDFVGRGIWTFQQEGKFCNITYDWEIEAEKPLLKYLSFLLKPIFSANHEWAMAKGLESLKLELARRRAASETEKQRIPAPPPPTFPHNLLKNNMLLIET